MIVRHRAVSEAPVLQHCAMRPGMARDKWFLATVTEFDPSKKLLAEKSRGSRVKPGQHKQTLQAVSVFSSTHLLGKIPYGCKNALDEFWASRKPRRLRVGKGSWEADSRVCWSE